jgi:peptidoglycan/LPS O-acetylase OafA/YrhL
MEAPVRRIPEFDALRGLAALGIVVLHLWCPSFTPLSTGVNLFFVLSGYLITSIILKSLDDENFLTAFYGRRALRIWPIYYLALAALLAWRVVTPVPEPLDGLPYYLTYTQNFPSYWFGTPPPFLAAFGHTWTLAIEEQFYILWPLLLVCAGRRAVAPLAVGFVVLAVAARAAGFSYWILPCQTDGLALGALLAALAGTPLAAGPRFERSLLAVAAVSVVMTVKGAAWLGGLGGAWVPVAASLKVLFTNLFYFGLVGLVARRSGAPALRPLRSTWLCYLGQISYGIYLYHYILITTMEQLLDNFGLARTVATDVVAFTLVLTVSQLSWHYVERPILGLKGRFEYRPRTTVIPVPAAAVSSDLARREARAVEA